MVMTTTLLESSSHLWRAGLQVAVGQARNPGGIHVISCFQYRLAHNGLDEAVPRSLGAEYLISSHLSRSSDTGKRRLVPKQESLDGGASGTVNATGASRPEIRTPGGGAVQQRANSMCATAGPTSDLRCIGPRERRRDDRLQCLKTKGQAVDCAVDSGPAAVVPKRKPNSLWTLA
ncbi:Nn.00g098960.m01.CDS01 [Neocucurbitaria sp. VM-36]